MTIAKRGTQVAASRCFFLRLVALTCLMAPAYAGAQDFDADGIDDNLDNCVLVANSSQVDVDGDGWGNRCDSDFNNDGVVNPIDLGYIKSVFFTPDPLADLNGDGIVNPIDLGLFKQQFFGPPGPAGYANWVTSGDGDWEVASNWFPAAVPPPQAHVTIDQPGDITVSFPRASGTGAASFSAASITTSNNIAVLLGTLTVGQDVNSSASLSLLGGTLDIAGTLSVDGELAITAPATLAGATVAPNLNGDDLVPVGNGVSLDGLTLQRDLVMGNAVQVYVEDGLTLDDADIYLASTGTFCYLNFAGDQTLGGTGTVHFSGTTGNDSRNRLFQNVSGATLTIGAGVTVDTDTTGGYLGNTPGSMVLLGAVQSDVAGRLLTIGGDTTVQATVSGSNGGNLRFTGSWTNSAGNTISMAGGGLLELNGDWTNLGTINVTDSAIDIGASAADAWANDGTITVSNSSTVIGGTALTADVVSIDTDGPVSINGVVSNAGTDFNLDSLAGGVSLATGGTIQGGTVSGNASLIAGPANPATLSGVTMNTDLVMQDATQLVVQNGLTLNNTNVSLNSSGSFCYFRFDGSQTLDGLGSVLFAGTTGSDTRNRMWQNTSGATLIVASGITIETDTTGGYFGVTPGTIDFRGTVISDVSGRLLRVGGDLILDGPLSASGGGDLRIQDTWINQAGNTIAMTGGGLLELNGDWDNLGIVSVTNSEFSIGATVNDDWTNNGSITLVSSPAQIGGSFDTANLQSIVSDDVVVIDGNLDNDGTTFVTDTFPAGVSLGTGGAVIGGTVSGTASLVAGPANPARLIGVTLATDMELSNAAQVFVTDGLTLVDVNVTFGSSGSFCYLRFDGTQTLGGTGNVRFGGSSSGDTSNRLWQSVNGQTLTIDSGIAIDTLSAGGYVGETPGSILLLGSVTSDLNGRLVRIGGNTTIDGSVTSSNGGELRILGTWTNEAGNTISATSAGLLELEGTWSNSGNIIISNTTVDLGGSFNTATLVSISSDGTINIDGNIDNSGTTLNLDLLPNGLALDNGSTLTGGTVSGSIDLELAAGATSARLDAVTLATDLLIPNGSQAIIGNGLTLSNANVVLASDGALAYLRFDGSGTQTLAGTGEVRFAGTTTADNDNIVLLQSANTDLTIGSNVTLRTFTSGGRIGTAGSEVTIQGAIISNLDNRKLDLLGLPVTLEGSATIGDASQINLISNGALVLDSAADIDMDIGPASHSSMALDNSIALAGDLNIALVDGATPAPCELTDAFTWESFSGDFDIIAGPDFGAGQTYDLIGLDTVGQLQVPGTGCTYEVSRWPGNSETASTTSSGNTAARGNDSTYNTYWCALGTEPTPQLVVALTEDVTVTSVAIDNALGTGNQFLTGRIRLLNGSAVEIYNSGVLALSAGDLNHDVTPDTGSVRSIIFEGVTWGGSTPCIGELDAQGTAP